MKPTSSHDAAEFGNDAVEHEHSDVNVRAILGFGGIVAAVTIVCAVIVWGVFNLFERMAVARDPQRSPLAAPARPMPGTTAASPMFGSAAGVPLLVNEPAALATQRLAEQKLLHGYGWIDEKAGVAHLPIEQAKKLLAERGLPARPGGADPLLGTHAPAFGEATGGRSIPTGAKPAGATPTAPSEPLLAPAVTVPKEGVAPLAPVAPTQEKSGSTPRSGRGA